ncbi:1713_t:CDS:10 [Diversispora eburnea]|uniref:Transcription elongation factor SPT6 n=1 Tax=Diversispora eburnea TaxID=1213867 RepID=A0A9N8VCN7_9GLOM|nr:1713_t:CDS:10 [Diversispora eburnea]
MSNYHFSSKNNNETTNEESNEENEGLLEMERKIIKRGRNMIISKISDDDSHMSEVNTPSDEPEFKRLKSDRLVREEVAEECEDEIPEIPDEDEIIDDQILESESESRETSLDSNFSIRMKMIEEDNAIKTKDLPERMLLRPNIITDRKLTDEEVTEATKIISDNFSEYYGRHRSSKLQAAINKVLKCLSQEFLEVPYIYSYRRYYIADFHKDFSISREILNPEAAIKDPSTHQHLKEYSFYIECLSKGTHELVKYMGVDVELFSRSLVEENPKLYQVTESEFGPSIAKEFSEINPKEALATATKLLSLDIAFDPLFRKYVRQNFIKRSVIIVNPLQEIDESDPCWQFRCSRRHIKKFRNTGIFAEMMSAEKKGQIEIKVILENEYRFFETLKKRIINNSSESNNNNNCSWNKYRISAIKQAFNNELRPIMESWIKSRLNKFAERWIMTKTMENFENKLNVCHFRTSKMSRNEISRVAALSWGSGINCDTECVFLDENCNLADYLSFNNLRDNRDMEEFYKVIQFIRKNKPHVIVIRCFDGRTRYLLEIVQEVVDYYKLQGGDHIPVIAINNEVAKLYMSSPRAKKEFPNHNDLTRYCISLARMLQNPIGEYAVLEESVASIIHHPLQSLLSHEKLIECLQRGFINIINEIGVDFNQEMNKENKIDLLQYVSGLGPHKVDDLIGKILTNGKKELEKRDHILKNYSMGNVVYTNCAGFIRVQSYRCGPFDNTRIHPRYYALASKMVRDSFDLDEEGDGVINDSCLKLWTRRLTSEPEKINDLVLDDYAKRLSKYHRFTSNLIMHNIKMELVRPYADPRRNFEILSPEQVFEMEMEETYEMLNTELRDALTFNNNNKHGITVRESSIQSIQNLANKSIGSYVVRPSSKGYGFISITWKIYSNIFQHVDIVEKEKYGDSIGKKLEVEGGKYVYSDLKELLKEYIEQKVQTALDLMIHKRFFPSEEDSRSIRPEGYKFSGSVYPTLSHLVKAIKNLIGYKRKPLTAKSYLSFFASEE